ncbi:N-acetylmuramoyl-L-alanine amidase [Alphaproteobacteria bacterium]|nr:N-acetylmuramoyl-L-alanine amidase [Alphaproteobacteria bacterium]
MSKYNKTMVKNLSYRSENFDNRKSKIEMIVIHYTGMHSRDLALKKLCNRSSKVSSHYLIDEQGEIYYLVDESKRAWHAGFSSWFNESDINSLSIGIELVNPGHEINYLPFTELQMNSLEKLVLELKSRYSILKKNIVGHSDVAPLRKSDPGELFDWDRLAKKGLAFSPDIEQKIKPLTAKYNDKGENVFIIQEALYLCGYKIIIDGLYGISTQKIVKAFQRRFRRILVNGNVDSQTSKILFSAVNSYKLY